MRYRSNLFIHCVCAFTFFFSALAPTLSHAVAASNEGATLNMEICAADGGKQSLDLDTDQSIRIPTNCPYCVAQSPALLNLLTNLQFGMPESFTITPILYLDSIKTLFVWVKLPSQGPPQNTRT